jgi:Plectin/S10 domain
MRSIAEEHSCASRRHCGTQHTIRAVSSNLHVVLDFPSPGPVPTCSGGPSVMLTVAVAGAAEGVLYAEKDFNLPKHPQVDVSNLVVIKLMQSFKSRELVTERFAWRHYYWCVSSTSSPLLLAVAMKTATLHWGSSCSPSSRALA